jgi:hypothetical protein
MPVSELIRVLEKAQYALVKSRLGRPRLVTCEEMVEFMTRSLAPAVGESITVRMSNQAGAS